MPVSIASLIDDLPTESLEIFTAAYELGIVGGWHNYGSPPPGQYQPWKTLCCPRAALGFFGYYWHRHEPAGLYKDTDEYHPARRIEARAYHNELDINELYQECVLALIDRDQQLLDHQAHLSEETGSAPPHQDDPDRLALGSCVPCPHVGSAAHGRLGAVALSGTG